MPFVWTLLPIQAGLQACSLLFLIFGFVLIRQRAVTGHTLLMSLALLTTTLCLAVSLGVLFLKEPQALQLDTLIQWIHYGLWLFHLGLGFIIYPFIIVVLWRALLGKMIDHARMARQVMLFWIFFLILGLYLFWNGQGVLYYE